MDAVLSADVGDAPMRQRQYTAPIHAPSAKAPNAVLQRMLQPLLADSFKLATHREDRDTDVFGLVVARPNRLGPQLRRSEDACDDRVGTAAFARWRSVEGARRHPASIRLDRRSSPHSTNNSD